MAVKQYTLCFQLLWAGRSGAYINGTGRMAQVEWRRCEKMLGTCAMIKM